MRNRQRRVLAVVVLAVIGGALPAFANGPETGADPTVTLTVIPSDFLFDGQTVTVFGTGFPPNTQGTIRECGGTAAAPDCDQTVNVPFTTTAAGTIPTTSVTVKRIINTGSTTYNCGAQSCWLVATAGEKSSQHHIRMASAGTSIPGPTSSIPPTSSPPTSGPPTTVPPTTTPPTSIVPTTVPPTTILPTSIPLPTLPPTSGALCDGLRALRVVFPGLSGLFTILLQLFSCPPVATGG